MFPEVGNHTRCTCCLANSTGKAVSIHQWKTTNTTCTNGPVCFSDLITHCLSLSHCRQNKQDLHWVSNVSWNIDIVLLMWSIKVNHKHRLHKEGQEEPSLPTRNVIPTCKTAGTVKDVLQVSWLLCAWINHSAKLNFLSNTVSISRGGRRWEGVTPFRLSGSCD